MDYIFDENYNQYVAAALNELETPEGRNRVFSTSVEFGKSIKDFELIPKIAERGAVLVTKDLNMGKRKGEFELLKQHKVSVVFVRTNAMGHWDEIELLIRHWRKITKECDRLSRKPPFFIRVKTNGTIEIMAD